jgi:hypothetical protein
MDILRFLFNWFMNNWDNVLVVFVFVGVLVFMWFKLDKKEWVKRTLLRLVVTAEEEYGSGTGLVKYNVVIDEFYNIMPKILKVFISRKMIDFYLEEALNKLKELLASGVTLESYYQEL